METLVTRPRVPSEPMKRCFRSYPVLSFFMLWRESDREIWKIKTWKGSRRSPLMQALLPPQEQSHEGFHTCMIFSIYGHIFQGWFSFGNIWDCIYQVVCIFYLSKRNPPAFVLTLPPMWQLPCKHQLIFCHIFVASFWFLISTLAPRSRGTIIPWSAKVESSVSRTTPAWT